MKNMTTTVPFVTCDLLDDHTDKDIQVLTPSLDGRFLKVMALEKYFQAKS